MPQQQEIHDTLKVHCQQGGLCLVLGVPGTGKTVIKQSLQRLPENQYLIASVARTLHTYTNTVKILCNAFLIEFESNAFKCERKLIEQAFSLNHAGKCLTTILDDAHLMDLANLRKLRLLFEDFPKNHNLVLIGQPSLLANLDLGVNSDIKSRVTYSVITKRLKPRRPAGVPPARTRPRRPWTQHLDRPGHRPHRPLGRWRPPQGKKPLRRLPDPGGPLRQQDHRHRQRQPRLAATPLAKGKRPDGFLIRSAPHP